MAAEVGVGHLRIRLFNLYLDGGRVGGVAYCIHGDIGEGVLAGLVLVGGVDKLAVLPDGHRTPGRLLHQPVGQQVALRVHGGKAVGDRHIFIGGQFQILRHWGAVGLGQQMDLHPGLLSGLTAGKERLEGKAGLQSGWSDRRSETQAVHGGHGDHIPLSHHLASQGEHTFLGQLGDHDGVQSALPLHHKVRGLEGDGLGGHAVLHHVQHRGAGLLLVQKERRGRQGRGEQGGRQRCGNQDAGFH